MKPLNSQHSRTGFTLLELVIAITVLGIVLALTVPFFRTQVQAFGNVSGRDDAQQNARYGVSMIDRELRIAGIGVVDPQPMIVQASPNAITFNVDGFGTGKANVRIPAALNNTSITVYEDTGIIASTSTKNGTEYDIQFNFALSQHKISIIYGKPPSGLAFFLGLLTNPIAIIAYIIIAVSVAAVAAIQEQRRRRPSVPAPEPTETGPGANGSPSPPVPPPSTESPAQLPSTNN